MNWIIISSGDGLLPVWHQVITWTKGGLSWIGLSKNISMEFLFQIHPFSFTSMHLIVGLYEMEFIITVNYI